MVFNARNARIDAGMVPANSCKSAIACRICKDSAWSTAALFPQFNASSSRRSAGTSELGRGTRDGRQGGGLGPRWALRIGPDAGCRLRRGEARRPRPPRESCSRTATAPGRTARPALRESGRPVHGGRWLFSAMRRRSGRPRAPRLACEWMASSPLPGKWRETGSVRPTIRSCDAPGARPERARVVAPSVRRAGDRHEEKSP